MLGRCVHTTSSLCAGPCLLACTPLISALTCMQMLAPRPPAGPSDGIAREVSPASSSERQPHEPSSSSQRRAGEQGAASTSSQWYAGEQDAARSRRRARDTGFRIAAVPEEEYRPTKEEFKRAVERSGIPESQKRKLLGAPAPVWALTAVSRACGTGAGRRGWRCAAGPASCRALLCSRCCLQPTNLKSLKSQTPGVFAERERGLRTATKRKGRKMDVRKSSVSDPAKWDIPVEQAPQTTWRPDLMKRLTYTQFWQLVKERQIDKVWSPLPPLEC